MAEFPALPLFTDALLGDTTHLDATEFGAYLLMLIVAWRSPDCALPDDDRYLARISRLGRRWSKLRPVLLAFWTRTADGRLHQKKLDKVRKFASDNSREQARKAQLRWLKDKETPNAAASPGHMPEPCLQNQNQNHIQVDREKDSAESLSAMPTENGHATELPLPHTEKANGHDHRQRGSRLPNDWRPGDENCRRCEALGLDLETQITEFRNYWCALPGSRGLKLDWNRTFHNRIVEVAGRQGVRGEGQRASGSRRSSILEAGARVIARARERGDP